MSWTYNPSAVTKVALASEAALPNTASGGTTPLNPKNLLLFIIIYYFYLLLFIIILFIIIISINILRYKDSGYFVKMKYFTL